MVARYGLPLAPGESTSELVVVPRVTVGVVRNDGPTGDPGPITVGDAAHPSIANTVDVDSPSEQTEDAVLTDDATVDAARSPAGRSRCPAASSLRGRWDAE